MDLSSTIHCGYEVNSAEQTDDTRTFLLLSVIVAAMIALPDFRSGTSFVSNG